MLTTKKAHLSEPPVVVTRSYTRKTRSGLRLAVDHHKQKRSQKRKKKKKRSKFNNIPPPHQVKCIKTEPIEYVDEEISFLHKSPPPQPKVAMVTIYWDFFETAIKKEEEKEEIFFSDHVGKSPLSNLNVDVDESKQPLLIITPKSLRSYSHDDSGDSILCDSKNLKTGYTTTLANGESRKKVVVPTIRRREPSKRRVEDLVKRQEKCNILGLKDYKFYLNKEFTRHKTTVCIK